jgi:hypothetical protein
MEFAPITRMSSRSRTGAYEGQFLREIGDGGVTSYPIAVEINTMEEVVVANNHYNFKLTVSQVRVLKFEIIFQKPQSY